MKRVLGAAGLPQVAYRVFSAEQWRRDPQGVREAVAEQLGFPCFIKPASLGSSVGVSRVDRLEELGGAMEEAARLGQKVVVEEAVRGYREIELGVLGNEDAQVSVPGEVIPAADYYDSRAKYEDDQTQLIVPAAVKPATAAKLAEMALAAFRAIDGTGLARVDFFVSPDEERILVNEINTMPGFTRVSMYPRLWIHSGVSYEDLVNRLIALADERHREKTRVARAQGEWRPRSAGGTPPGDGAWG